MLGRAAKGGESDIAPDSGTSPIARFLKSMPASQGFQQALLKEQPLNHVGVLSTRFQADSLI